MKTPREILLERHQAATPKLDAIRQSAVAAVCDRRPVAKGTHERRSQTAATMIWHVLWRELVLPSRRIWAGLAAVWVLLLTANFSLRDHSQTTMAKSALPPDMILAFRQQEKLLAELIGPAEPRAAAPPKAFSPQPSSRRRIEIVTT